MNHGEQVEAPAERAQTAPAKTPSYRCEPLQSVAVDEPWVRFLTSAAARDLPADAASPFLGWVQLKPGYDAVRVQGLVAPRAGRGRTTPRWCYALILRASEERRPVLLCQDHEALRLQAGQLVEFDQKRRHRIDQRDGDILVWAPVFSKDRLSLDNALAAHRRAFAEGLQLASRVAPTEIYGADHRIAHDGETVRVFDPEGVCLAYFERRGFALCRRLKRLFDVETDYLLLARRRPRLADWARLTRLASEHLGIALPDEVMPAWLVSDSIS